MVLGGGRLTHRSLSDRLVEIARRLAVAAKAAAPELPDTAWALIGWAGWDAVQSARVTSPSDDVDVIAWSTLVIEVAGRDAALAERLRAMTAVERVAVLERIEAYGRAQALERG